jgi:FHA domain.
VNIHGEDVNIHQCKINLPDGNVGEPEEMPENANLLKKIPVMDEKITDDREIFYYPLKTYLYTGICCLGAVLIFVMSFYTKLVYNSLGNRIDYGKLTVLILMVFVAAGYLISKIWDKKNRLTKVVRKVEYIDPRKYPENQDIGIINENTSACTSFQNTYSSKSIGLKNANEAAGAINPTVLLNFKDENNNPTVLLNADKPTSGCRLEPKENDKYDVIRMTEFPFIIGKQKGNVDYFLDMDVVSRYHVKITREEDKYYITDLNSTNGTCLNKKPLSCYQRYELKEGDEVTIAGIVYMFRETA